MLLQLLELKAKDKKMKKVKAESKLGSKQDLKDSWEEVERVFYHQSLLYKQEVIYTELISRHHNDLLIEYFDIKKTWELIA